MLDACNILTGKDLECRWRQTLIDWVIKVCDKFCLMQETLYATVDIMVRYLAVSSFELFIYILF